MSLSKNQIKNVSALHLKKYRDETGHFIVEGEKIIAELFFQQKYKIVCLYALNNWIECNKIQLINLKIEFHTCSEKDMERISILKTPSPVLCVLKKNETNLSDPKYKQNLILEGIQDPGNLGTIIRTADWFGIENIYCSEDSVELTNPKVLQASMGSFLRVNINYVNLENLIQEYPEISCYAAVLNGKNAFEIKYPAEMFLLIGNEGRGLSEKILSLPNIAVSIPKYGTAESLNAGIATAVLCAKLKM
jgi:TrmH family RNA methyltransferase